MPPLFDPGKELEAYAASLRLLYNQQLPQSALAAKTPLQADEELHNSNQSCSRTAVLPSGM